MIVKTEDNKPFYHSHIPSNWEVIELGEITTLLTNGFVGKAKEHYVESDDGITYIQGYNITEAGFNFFGIKKVSKSFHAKNKKSCLEEGDLLTIQTGDIGLTSLVPKELIGANCHALIISRFKKELAYPHFFLHYFNSGIGQRKFKTIETGSTMKHLNVGDMISLQLPLPPLPEQKAIAHILSLMDKAININNQLIAQKELRKKWLMQNLLTGKKRLKGFEGEWKKKKLKSVAYISRGASPRPIQDPRWFSEKGRGWIRISDVTSSHFYLNQTKQYLSEEGADKSVKVDKGDLIMSICATIGVPVIVNIPACIHDGFVLLRNYEKNITTFFLYYYIQYITEKLAGEGQPGTQKNLNTSIVGNIQLNLPNLEEQDAIAQLLQATDKEIQLLKAKTEKLREQKKGMMQVLLTGKKRLKV